MDAPLCSKQTPNLPNPKKGKRKVDLKKKCIVLKSSEGGIPLTKLSPFVIEQKY